MSSTSHRNARNEPTSHPGQTDAGMPKARKRDAKSLASESPIEGGGTMWSDSRPKERPGAEPASARGDNAPIESSSSLEGGSSDAHDEATHSHEESSSVEIAPDERGDADPRDD